MKTCAAFYLVLVLFCIHSTVLTQSQLPSIDATVSQAPPQFIMADIAGFPFNHTHSASWQPYQSVRIGYGRKLEDMLELRVYGEYTQFDFDTNDPMSTLIYSPGRRRDFAIYPAVVAAKIVEIGFGGYYKIQDEVLRKQLFDVPDVPSITTFTPAVKKFGIYFQYGLSGTVHMMGPLNISMGIFMRHELNDATSFGGRAGVKYEL